MSLTQLPGPIINKARHLLGDIEIRNFTFSSGGCINNGGVLSTSGSNLFIKWNQRKAFPGMFDAEKKGLQLLAENKGLRIPEVISTGETEDYSFIILEYLKPSHRAEDYWLQLGFGLAKIHMKSAQLFGLDHDNFIGSLPQMNSRKPSWAEFFIHNRLLFQLKLARENKRIGSEEARKFETSILKLSDIIPDAAPSLLHGDLWAGNLITGPAGEPCLIDPAVYFGHHEMDLAMSRLFGGFDDMYLQAYNEISTLEAGYKSRFDLWNLYPLMVHVNLFGGSYLNQVKQVLKKFQ